MTARDALTVLHSTSGKYATKQFSVRPKTGEFKNRSYGNEKYFLITHDPQPI